MKNRTYTQKLGESSINYIKIFQNAKALEISVGGSYSEYQLMHILFDNLQQGIKHYAQVASHQEELRREEKFVDEK